jgi:hypothetical protein
MHHQLSLTGLKICGRVGAGKYAGQRVKECAGPGVQVGDLKAICNTKQVEEFFILTKD